jgi:23S rRNA pseudoU1915 N3-methylase RlmH
MKPQKPPVESRSTLIGSRRAKTIVSVKEQKETKEKAKPVLVINASQNKAVANHPSPNSPSLHSSQTLGKGRSRVLLCIDNDDDDVFTDFPFPATDTLDFFSTLGDDNSPENPTLQPESEQSITAPQVSIEEVKPRTTSVSPLRRKVSQVVKKFAYLQKMMPQYKLDKELKTEITTTMVDLNYWSDNDLEEIQKEKDLSPSPKRTSSLERKDKISSPAGSITLDGGRSRSTVFSTQSSKSQLSQQSQTQQQLQQPQRPQQLQKQFQPPKPQQSQTQPLQPSPRQPIRIYQSPPIPKPEVQIPQDQQKSPRKVIIITKPTEISPKKTQPAVIQSPSATVSAHTVIELSQPVTVKRKVELVKPKQIQISQQVQAKVAKMEKTKEEERKNIREQIVSKAVQSLIKLENDQVTSSQKKHLSNVKDKNDKKVKLLKRFAHGIVDKAIKKMKREAYERSVFDSVF